MLNSWFMDIVERVKRLKQQWLGHIARKMNERWIISARMVPE